MEIPQDLHVWIMQQARAGQAQETLLTPLLRAGWSEVDAVEAVERRVAALLDWPRENGQGLQVLRYSPGGRYEPHYDWFDPAAPGSAAALARGGQRLASLVMYLNTPQRGATPERQWSRTRSGSRRCSCASVASSEVQRGERGRYPLGSVPSRPPQAHLRRL